MPKTAKALLRLPPQTAHAIEAMGAHLAVARVRRKQSLQTWAGRVGVSVPTLMRMEGGDPGVAMGLYASALWLIGRDGELARIAAPEHDQGALELDVRRAMDLGRKRALAAQRTRATRAARAARAPTRGKAAVRAAKPARLVRSGKPAHAARDHAVSARSWWRGA